MRADQPGPWDLIRDVSLEAAGGRELPGLPDDVSELELDLLCALARLEQIRREGVDTCGGLILDRLLECDVPRLRRHLRPAAIAWAEELEA